MPRDSMASMGRPTVAGRRGCGRRLWRRRLPVARRGRAEHRILARQHRRGAADGTVRSAWENGRAAGDGAAPQAPDAAADGLRRTGVLNASGDNPDVTLRAPNTMWVQAGLPLSPEFTDQLRDAAMVAVRPSDFAGAPRGGAIADQPADRETDGREVHRLARAGAISAATRLVLANAVYLKSAWAFPFPGHATSDAPFYPGPMARRPGTAMGS